MSLRWSALVLTLVFLTYSHPSLALTPEEVNRCTQLDQLESDRTSKEVSKLSIMNLTKKGIYVKWVRTKSDYVDFLNVERGTFKGLSSFTGNYWLLTDDMGKCMAVISLTGPEHLIKLP